MNKIITLVLLSLCTMTSYAEVAVVVHLDNNITLDKFEVSRIFLGKTSEFPNGKQAVPINQGEDSKAMKEFTDTVLNKSDRQLQAYWSKMLFTGKGSPPKTVLGDKEILELVASNPNIIGYVDAKAVNENVRVLAIY